MIASTATFRGEMTTPSASETRDLLVLAERMGIPAGEAMRQVARVSADAEDPVVEGSAEPEQAREPVLEPAPEPTPEPDPASASVA